MSLVRYTVNQHTGIFFPGIFQEYETISEAVNVLLSNINSESIVFAMQVMPWSDNNSTWGCSGLYTEYDSVYNNDIFQLSVSFFQQLLKSLKFSLAHECAISMKGTLHESVQFLGSRCSL